MISIVIPVYNEEDHILNLLQHLEKVTAGNVLEIICVDGGSSDRTPELLKEAKEVSFISSGKGRARQMNAGAAIAKGTVLYFLHADSYPPQYFDALIVDAIAKNNLAGCFQMKFDKDHWWLKLMGQFTRINHKACRGGDQSLFVQKKLFREIGGFDENYAVYEDNDFIARLYDKKQFVVLKKWLTTSARLYETKGVWQLQFIYLQIYWKKYRGAGPNELYSFYKSQIG